MTVGGLFYFAVGVLIGWNVRKYRDLPKELLRKAKFWQKR